VVLEPPSIGTWAVTHAMVPFVRTAAEDLELFFSSRDSDGRSHTGRAALTFEEGRARATPSAEPVLSPGALGAFDDSGAMGSCLVRHDGKELLYYIGWSRGVTVPFATFIGLALSEDGGRSFRRVSRAPVIGRTDADPFLATAPWVLVEDGRWRMWYASGVRWEATERGPKHLYRIVYAESHDGMTWTPSGDICIDFADDREYAITRPCVVRDPDRYRMWFSHRGTAYEIGYAESEDGMCWQRQDEVAGLRTGHAAWESASVEYGSVFDHDGKRWMFYNGNDYGATGVGLAEQQRA
jgi:hypothetical protein